MEEVRKWRKRSLERLTHNTKLRVFLFFLVKKRDYGIVFIIPVIGIHGNTELKRPLKTCIVFHRLHHYI